MARKTIRITPKDVERIKKAEKDFHALLEEVKPFIKQKQKPYESTAGQWKVVSFE